MAKKINLEDIINNGFNSSMLFWMKEAEYREIFIKDAMLEFGKQLLELAAQNVKNKTVKVLCDDPKEGDDAYMDFDIIDKDSILDTIKLVEYGEVKY